MVRQAHHERNKQTVGPEQCRRVRTVILGYTLIELLIVLALFILITTLSLTNFGFLNRAVTRSELHHLHSVCRYLQYKALASKQKQTLFFDVKNNSYTLNDTKYQLPKTISFGVLPNIKGPPASPSKVVTKPITFKNNTIVFHPDGIISSGTVYVRDMQSDRLYALTSGVAQVSFVRLYLYNKTWQLLS